MSDADPKGGSGLNEGGGKFAEEMAKAQGSGPSDLFLGIIIVVVILLAGVGLGTVIGWCIR